MTAKPYALEAGRQAVTQHLRGTAPRARMAPLTTPGPACRIECPLPLAELHASLILLTRDRLDLLQPAVESLLETTADVSCELILVDHDILLAGPVTGPDLSMAGDLDFSGGPGTGSARGKAARTPRGICLP